MNTHVDLFEDYACGHGKLLIPITINLVNDIRSCPGSNGRIQPLIANRVHQPDTSVASVLQQEGFSMTTDTVTASQGVAGLNKPYQETLKDDC